MKDAFKNKNLLVIVFELIIIILGIIGITFATSKILNDRASITVKGSEYGVDYQGDTDIKVNNLSPISDSLINKDTKDNVIRIEFSLRGLKKDDSTNLIYNVMLKDINIDCGLLNKYTKWNLYKNDVLLSSGSLDPAFDGNVLTDNMRLTTIEEDLPKSTDEYDKYVLLFWISESCDNLENCELVDQSSIIGSTLNTKVFIALARGSKKEYVRVPNYDNSCASKPILSDNMIPVNYQNGSWIVSDTSNKDKNNLWYNYSDSKWANAVVVKNKSKYSIIGTVIDNNDVLGYFVWIPRFRYKLWNAEEIITDTYNAYNKGIDIIFENNLNSISGSKNNEYLTHPVFKDNIKGFWISKYEISKNNDNYTFIPNTESYTKDTIENYKTISSNIATNYNLDNNIESHMINNLEWGATLYLSHSKYGVCKNNKCEKIDKNTTYISGNNKQDTTTRNVYGIYDMAGASGEFVNGSSNNLGSATKEVILENNDTWYNGHGIVSDRDYIIRGGLNKELFYFGDISMDEVANSTRITLVNK